MEMQNKKVWGWLCAALLIMVVPNLICWGVQLKVFMMRGIFVWEYLVLACLYPYISRKLFIGFWVLFSLFDIVSSACSLFFMDFFEVFHALAKMPDLSVASLLKWAGLLTLFIALTIALFTSVLERYNRTYSFLRLKFLWPFIVGLLIVDFFNGHGPLRKWSVKLIDLNTNIVSVPTYGIYRTISLTMFSAKKQEQKVEYLGSVAHTVFARQPDSLSCKKEVLVLVESWGLLEDTALRREVLSPLHQIEISSLYKIKEGRQRYKFLTQAGEFREITGYLFHSFQANPKWLNEKSMIRQKSLFVKKQKEGYRVIGLHGFSSQFYKRKEIWPALGVQETMFAEDFRKESMAMCGDVSFHGICDTSITTWLMNKMNSEPERKEFYYWVTLSTHLPLIEIHDEKYRRFAEKWKTKGVTENVLQIAYQFQLLFKDLAVKLSKPGAPKAHFLLVGDHAPPFTDPADRKSFSHLLVPYVELIPY